ncbi:MAG: hypothetical protein KA712_23525 [Myxococcales bacterium]|nr:hypothetical protein [Myxococcales bacterium]
MAAPSANASSAAKCQCQAWAIKTLKSVKRVPMRKARAVIIASLANGCDAIPADLKAASRLRTASEQALELATAASRVLGPNCLIADPLGPATMVPAACEGMGLKPSNVDVKADMRAADYVLFLAMQKLWEQHSLSNDASERLFDTFELSAALWGEELRAVKSKGSKLP